MYDNTLSSQLKRLFLRDSFSPEDRKEYMDFYQSYTSGILQAYEEMLIAEIVRGEEYDMVEFPLSERYECQAGGTLYLSAWGFVNPPS
mmetsp:Transcript_18122/g.13175  ORF Transcript_18122/g.13175 Transcript_18122/m.13175 type:complete len:88 (-) Transcript_18122:911-1174(-)